MFRTAEIKMPKLDRKTLTILVVPAVVAMTAQTAAASKPYHARVKDCVAVRRQLWKSMSSPNGMSIGGTTLYNSPGTRENDLNVYRDGQPIPIYDIDAHGG
jgi:hypothetical protein